MNKQHSLQTDNQMEKRYIKPSTVLFSVAAQQMMAGSPIQDPTTGVTFDPNDNTTSMDSKEFDFVTEEEQAWKTEYKAFSLWED